MGIHGLWDIIKPALKKCSLTQLSVAEGFQQNRHDKKALVLGVDVSLWLMQCQSPFHYGHAQAGASPELQVLFYRLARFLHFPVILLFVFDGEGRPTSKRGKKVIKTPHWLTERVQEMITLFGFHWYTAPGEAEAELACLNKFGMVDAVLTEDGDAFVFGARQIIRCPDLMDSKDEITVYTADAIHNTPGAGLQGFGASTARGLAQSGFGDSLLEAARGDRSVFPQFLSQWRQDVRQQLRTDSGGHLGKRCAGLSTRISQSFPDVDIVDAYVFPYTSWSDGGTGPNLMPLTALLPDVTKIATFCERHFSWGGVSGILSKFHNTLWEGMCIRMLCEPLSQLQGFTPSAAHHISMRKLRPTAAYATSFVSYRISVGTDALDRLARQGIAQTTGPLSSLNAVASPSHVRPLAGAAEQEPRSSCPDRTCLVWVPAPILEAVLPATVEAYVARRGPLDPTASPESLLSNSQPIVAKSQDIIDLTKSEGSVGAVSQPTSQDVIDLSGERAASLDSVSRPSVGSNDVLELMDDGSWHRI